MEQLKLDITGMSCGHCVSRVRSALQSLPGVEVKSVEIGSANVAYDPGVTSSGTIAAAVTDAGYEARAVSAAA